MNLSLQPLLVKIASVRQVGCVLCALSALVLQGFQLAGVFATDPDMLIVFTNQPGNEFVFQGYCVSKAQLDSHLEKSY